MPLLNWLERIDKFLFMLVQHDSDHGLWDKVMPVLREPLTWIPLYLFMLYYAIRKGKDRAWLFIALSIVCVAITDSLSGSVLKPLIGRIRPCNDAEMQGYLRWAGDCGGLYSMPSSHAANHMGLAAFWYWSIYLMTGKKWDWLWIWAFAIGYAQVYVGKHYPFDIIAGYLLGYAAGAGMAKLFERGWNNPAVCRRIADFLSLRARTT